MDCYTHTAGGGRGFTNLAAPGRDEMDITARIMRPGLPEGRRSFVHNLDDHDHDPENSHPSLGALDSTYLSSPLLPF